MKLGTRGSRLALAQASQVIRALRQLNNDLDIETVIIQTTGDRGGDTALLGDGVFVKEIQRQLLEGQIDLAVHSLKDMPTDPVTGLIIAAVTEREDPRDAIVGTTLDSLRPGARVGTGSPRRSAQFLRLRPDVQVVAIRGNVPTRVEKALSGEVDAIVVALAGLNRLGIEADQVLEAEQMLPAPGQGAVAVEARDGEPELAALLSKIHHRPTRDAAAAERAVLRRLGGGCLLPVAALATVTSDRLRLEAAVTSQDGKRQIRHVAEVEHDKPLAASRKVANALVADGAMQILEELHGVAP
ncbi:MAG: hydroxymethylbilane synthase [Actinomycetota bacterium]|nr:hydroxymethylbilane synthase [Actinomycetota bacterium]